MGHSAEVKNDPKSPHPVVAHLWYEKGSDDQYYLRDAHSKHADGCVQPMSNAAADRARNIVFVPEGLMKHAKAMKRAGFSTSQANHFIEDLTTRAVRPVTWNWKHLDGKLSTVSGPRTGDAVGLGEWLMERKLEHGLYSEYTTDHMGCRDRVFYEVEGAQAYWKQSGGGAPHLF